MHSPHRPIPQSFFSCFEKTATKTTPLSLWKFLGFNVHNTAHQSSHRHSLLVKHDHISREKPAKADLLSYKLWTKVCFYSGSSGIVYGSLKVHDDLRELGESCGKNRAARLMNKAGLKAQVGDKKPRHKGGKVAIYAENYLKQKLDTLAPNQAWGQILPISELMLVGSI